MNKQTATKGFTLIELMISVAIVGILASIVYPSFQDSVFKSRRADAKVSLLGLANAMERHFTENNSYTGAAGTVATPANTGSPAIYAQQSPVDGGTAYYLLTIQVATANTYTIQAAPTGAQSTDSCGNLVLTHTGVKTPTTAGCW